MDVAVKLLSTMVKQLSILEDGTFSCDGLVCPLLSLYRDNAECADCPIVKVHEMLKSIDFDCNFLHAQFEEENPDKG